MAKNQSKNILLKILVNNSDAKFFLKKLLIVDWFKQLSIRRKIIIALVVLEILFLTGMLGIDLWLIISRDRHQLENQVQSDLELVEIFARIFMVLVVIKIFLIIILDKTLNNSLIKLKTIAQDFALGNWQKRAIVSQDEIGELALIFNQIADRIVNTLNQRDKNLEELKNINLELQQKIINCQESEVKLKQNQGMLSAIIDNSTAVIYVQDMQGKYLLVNRQFAELFNLKKAQIIGKNDDEFFPKSVTESFQKTHQIVIEAKRPLTVEELLPDKDGYHSYVSIKFPLDNLDGVPYAIGSISTNINYRKELQILLANVNEELEKKVAERTAFLRQANKLLRIEIAEKVQANKTAKKMTEELAQHARTVDGILNASVDLIYLFDLSGKYTYVSRTGAEVLGMKPEDMIGKTAKDLGFSQEIIQQFDEQIKTVLTTNKYVKSEGGFPTIKGVRNYEYILSPVCDEKGNIEAVVSTFRDMTERKHTQLELEFAKEAAEAANQAKSAFLANISHELKTPLNAIIGYSDLLNEEIIDLGYQDFINDLNKIRSESKNLLHKIQEIIDFAKIEANQMKLYLEDFHLLSLVNDVVKSVEPLVVKNGNILMVDGVEDTGIMYADPSKVQTIISNLLSNAAKFTHKGEITLRVSRQRDKIVFSVTDNGIGMSLDQIKYLFQPFTQADESTTRQYEGTGLGLAISQRLCQMMGGKISVDSKVGSGSTFTVCLPVEVQESKSQDFLETKEYESYLSEV